MIAKHFTKILYITGVITMLVTSFHIEWSICQK